jgi:hypothetical protein
LEVDICNNWNLAALRDNSQYVSIILRRHRNANNVTAGGGKFSDLLQGGIDVGGWSGGH